MLRAFVLFHHFYLLFHHLNIKSRSGMKFGGNSRIGSEAALKDSSPRTKQRKREEEGVRRVEDT